MTDGLKNVHREAIIAEIAANERVERAVLFGSRATGTNTVSSDVDIALFGDRLTLTDLARLAAALDEIPMAQTVDLLLHDSLQDRTLREHIRNQGIEWFARPMTTRSSFASRLFDASGDWSTMPFSDLVFFQEGPGIRNWQYRTEGVPFVNIRCLVNGRLDVDAMNCLDPREVQEKYRHFLLDEGDYVVSSSGTIGRIAEVCYEDLPCMLNTSVIRMRPKDNKTLDRRFLRYFLTSSAFQDQIRSLASGSVQVNYGPTHLEQVSILVPPRSEQRSIGHILGTLDDKIQLNRRMNATLEAMARALFRSWFVDFDPVRAKMEGRDTGLPKDIADLFPGQLVDSELGEIPKGWRASTLAEVARLNPESWSNQNAPARILYVDLAKTKWGDIDEIQMFSWADAPSRARRVLRRGDTIVGTVRPGNGSFALIDRDDLTGSTGFAVLRPTEPIEREIVWCAATSADAIDRLAHLADGGAYPAVSPKAVLDIAVALPNERIRLAFSSVAAPLLNRLKANQREARILGTLRDTLLPKIVSGELRVNGLEQASGSVDSSALAETHGA